MNGVAAELRRLAAADPVVLERVRSGAEPAADALLARILRPSPWRRRRALWLVPAALALCAMTWLVARSPEHTQAISCYEAPQTRARQAVTPWEPGISPEDACAELWREGVFGALGEDGVPALIACVSSHDAMAVVPGDSDMCGRLGWSPWDGHEVVSVPVAALRAELVHLHLSNACMDPSAARREAEEILAELDLDEWLVVDTEPLSPRRPCIGYGLDAQNRVVHLVPIRPPPPGS